MNAPTVDVYALGTSVPVLAAALELAEIGLSVRVAGGGHTEYLPEKGVGDPEGVLAAFFTHVATPLNNTVRVGDPAVADVSLLPRKRAPQPLMLKGRHGEWLAQPVPSVCGIPGVAVSREALTVLGGVAAARAYLDRVTPVLTVGKSRTLGPLVRTRLGKKVLDWLVEPVVRERFGLSADEIDVAVAVPGLNEALTVAGSLSGAVLMHAERDVAREALIRPEAGWDRLREALMRRLALYNVTFVASLPHPEQFEEGWKCVEQSACDKPGEAHRPEQVFARLLLADPTFEALAPSCDAVSQAAECLRPARWRAVIETVSDVEGPVRGADALHALQGDTGLWSVRVRVPGSGEADEMRRVECERTNQESAQPRAGHTSIVACGPAVRQNDARTMIAEGTALLDTFVPGTARSKVAVIAAPYATLAERHDAAELLRTTRNDHPDLLLVGVTLHGGDLSAAVADARREAVKHRRRLAGISDGAL